MARIIPAKTLRQLVGCLLLGMVVLLAGCGTRHTVVLVPDRDGTVGKAEVITAGGRQLLDKANSMTTVAGTAAAPTAVQPVAPAYISATFGEALAIQAQPSDRFILFFKTGTAILTPASLRDIPRIITTIGRRAVVEVAVSGHTDAVGSVQLNDRLARDRAERIRDILLQRGVSPRLISVSSHGKGNPLVPTPDGVAEPRNRRVEVIVR